LYFKSRSIVNRVSEVMITKRGYSLPKEAGTRDFAGVDLAGAELQGLALIGINLRGAN
jgi:uncharacterized protein YjbI with pentapeptide repeats